MLEWYRAYDNLQKIKLDVEKLVHYLAENMGADAPRAVKSYSVDTLFKKYCDFEIRPQTSKEELKALAQRCDVDVSSAESIDDFFFFDLYGKN